jgi:hypothetical protein
LGRVDVSDIPAAHIASARAKLSKYLAGLGVIIVPIISTKLSNTETFQAGTAGIHVGDVPPVAVENALGFLIPEDLAVLIPAISAVDKFIDAVAINVETSDLMVVGIV